MGAALQVGGRCRCQDIGPRLAIAWPGGVSAYVDTASQALEFICLAPTRSAAKSG